MWFRLLRLCTHDFCPIRDRPPEGYERSDSSWPKVSRIDVTNGDLLFFKRHVGIALGGEHLIHASLGGGGVRINSLESDGSDYRADLDHTFAIARRLL